MAGGSAILKIIPDINPDENLYTIQPGLTLELTGAFAGTIAFLQSSWGYITGPSGPFYESPCSLRLNNPEVFSANITGISIGDSIELPRILVSSATIGSYEKTGLLTVKEFTGQEITLKYHGFSAYQASLYNKGIPAARLLAVSDGAEGRSSTSRPSSCRKLQL